MKITTTQIKILRYPKKNLTEDAGKSHGNDCQSCMFPKTMLHAINLFKQKIFTIIESLHFRGYAFRNPSLAMDVYDEQPTKNLIERLLEILTELPCK